MAGFSIHSERITVAFRGSERTFAVARSAGWLAHALEEYRQPPLRFLPRSAYVGVRDGVDGSRGAAAGGVRKR